MLVALCSDTILAILFIVDIFCLCLLLNQSIDTLKPYSRISIFFLD